MTLVSAENEKRLNYPPTRTVPPGEAVLKMHGLDIPDPYRWLEDSDSEEVKSWTEEQNAFTASVLEKLPQRAAIEARLNELVQIGQIGPPRPRKGRYFYTKRTGSQNQAILYVRDERDGEDRVLVNPNKLSAEGTVALDWWFSNDDGSLLVYGLSKDGSEKSTLYIRDVKSGKDLPDVIPHTRAASLAWTPNGEGFFYTRYPTPGTVPEGQENYNRHVFYHKLGSDPNTDPLVFGDGRDPQDWPSVLLSPNGRWLLVRIERGWSQTEVFLKDLQTGGPFVTVMADREFVYDPVIRDDVLYIRTNEEAPRYRLFKTSPDKPGRENWQEIIPEGPDVLENYTRIGSTIVAHYMKEASSRLRLFDPDGQPRSEIKLPTLGSIDGIAGESNGDELFYLYSSTTIPPTVYHLDLSQDSGKPDIWQKLGRELKADDYEVQQVKYPSKDGTMISMFVAHRKGLPMNGANPAYLYGYGGFNISLTPFFRASLFLFLEQGGVVATANLRGGGEYGEAWHQAGMLEKKQNVFDDFHSAAEWLVAEKYTNPRRLAIEGRSNGGLLIGAAVTQRPDLFQVAICGVPLLDMLRYHKFRIAKLWIPEYGDPDSPEDFKWLRAYSPYHNVKKGTEYPAMLITSAVSDSRVDPMHARKMAAQLQAATGGARPILLRLETQAGHGQGKPIGKVVEELTDVWSLIFWQLGVDVDQ